MRIRKLALATALTLAGALLITVPAGASPTREFIGSFGSLEEPSGIAVDQETGNVYVVETKTDTVDIFSAAGGTPLGGVPTRIAGLHARRAKSASVTGVAVDNSCYEHEPALVGEACEAYDPSSGDVYVAESQGEYYFGVQKFKLDAGEYELASEVVCDPLGGYTRGEHLRSFEGVAVDDRGNLYCVGLDAPLVYELRKVVEKTGQGGNEEFQEKLEEVAIPQTLVEPGGPGQEELKDGTGPANVAVDGPGVIYISDGFENHTSYDRGVGRLKVGAAGAVEAEEIFTGTDRHGPLLWRPVAVDRASGAVFVGEGHEIAEFDSAGELQLRFGSTEAIGGSLGDGFDSAEAIAVNNSTGQVYVVNPEHGDVDVFGPLLAPPVIHAQQPAAEGVTRTSALISGVADPESGQARDYFEYVADAEYQPAAADPYNEGGLTPVVSMAGGHVPENIEHVALTGLKPGTTYHYRLVVSNANSTVYGPDEAFTTAPATPPGASTGPAGEVGATSASLTGVVLPRGLSTSYVFEVGGDTGYHGAKLFGYAGNVTGEVSVAVSLQYLVPGTTYHYRLVATSFDGSSYGQDQTFTTPSIASGIAQPGSLALIASPVVQFPSIVGAVAKQPGVARKTAAHKRSKGKCQAGSRKRQRKCEASARRSHRRAAKTTKRKKG